MSFYFLSFSVVIRLQTGQVEVSPQVLVRQSNGPFVANTFTRRTKKANIWKQPVTCKKWPRFLLWSTIVAQHDTCTVHIVYEAHSVLFFLMYVVGYWLMVMFNTEIVHALMACNAGTELTCISNIEEHVKLQNMPILSYILQRWV